MGTVREPQGDWRTRTARARPAAALDSEPPGPTARGWLEANVVRVGVGSDPPVGPPISLMRPGCFGGKPIRKMSGPSRTGPGLARRRCRSGADGSCPWPRLPSTPPLSRGHVDLFGAINAGDSECLSARALGAPSAGRGEVGRGCPSGPRGGASLRTPRCQSSHLANTARPVRPGVAQVSDLTPRQPRAGWLRLRVLLTIPSYYSRFRKEACPCAAVGNQRALQALLAVALRQALGHSDRSAVTAIREG